MIESISGKIEKILTKGIVLNIAGIGLQIQVPEPLKFGLNENVNLLIFWNWNSEKGPALFGFKTELEKKLFTLLLDCPKIGPQISLQILSQASAQKILQILAIADEHALSKFNGIGPKKAKSIVGELQSKAVELLAGLGPELEAGAKNSSFVLDEVCGALKSMGYTNSEITSAVCQIQTQDLDFSSAMRLALAQLLKQKAL